MFVWFFALIFFLNQLITDQTVKRQIFAKKPKTNKQQEQKKKTKQSKKTPKTTTTVKHKTKKNPTPPPHPRKISSKTTQ